MLLSVGATLGCGKTKPSPDPAKVVATDASTRPGSAITTPAAPDSARTTPLVQERTIDTPLVAPLKATTQLSIVGIRELGDFNPFDAQKDPSFEVWSFDDEAPAEKGARAKTRLVATQAGFVFTQKAPGGGGGQIGPLSLETKTITGSALSAAYRIQRLEGRWPDALFAEAEFQGALIARQQTTSFGVYERADGKWSKKDRLKEKLPDQVVAYGSEVLLARTAGALTVLRGTPPHPIVPTVGPGEKGCTGSEPPLYALAVDARAGSGVMTTGRMCRRGALAVERFSPKNPDGKGEIVPLPSPPSDLTPFTRAEISMGEGGAFAVLFHDVAKASYLAATLPGTDGLRVIELPRSEGLEGHPTSVRVTADGALFVMLRRPSGKGMERPLVLRLFEGAWTAFEPPPLPGGSGGAIVGHRLVAFDHATFVYGADVKLKEGNARAVLVGSSSTPVLGTTAQIQAFLAAYEAESAPPPAATAAPDSSAPAPAPDTSASATPPAPDALPASFPPFTEGCDTPFVDIFEVSKSAPATFTFPSTQKALATFASRDALHLVEFLHQGKRRLGAKVPSAEVGKALVEHIEKTMKDEKPRLVCFSPAPEKPGFREIALAPAAEPAPATK